MLIDHVVHAVPDLDAGVDDLERRLGVRAVHGGRHTGLGTWNALLSLGDRTYLELIAPDPGQPPPAVPRPFGVDDLDGPRLAGWALGVADIDAAVAAAREAGYDPGDAAGMERATPDGDVLRWRLTFNASGDGVVPFLIGWGDTPHPAAASPAGCTLESLAVEHPDPPSLEPVLRALGADVAVRRAAAPALVAVLRGPAGTIELR